MQYIYPPRPENIIPRTALNLFDNNTFLAQPKFNGDCSESYTSNKEFWFMNRHKRVLPHKLPNDSIKYLMSITGNNCFVGEYMNKSKKDHNNKVFNNKIVLFDIIVHKGSHLLKTTYEDRILMLEDLFKPIAENDYCYQLTEDLYLTKTFYKNFGLLWDKFVKIDMLEGLVLKLKSGKLEPGTRSINNSKTQIKCRKATKNYSS